MNVQNSVMVFPLNDEPEREIFLGAFDTANQNVPF